MGSIGSPFRYFWPRSDCNIRSGISTSLELSWWQRGQIRLAGPREKKVWLHFRQTRSRAIAVGKETPIGFLDTNNGHPAFDGRALTGGHPVDLAVI